MILGVHGIGLFILHIIVQAGQADVTGNVTFFIAFYLIENQLFTFLILDQAQVQERHFGDLVVE